MKIVLVLIAVAILFWLMFGGRRRTGGRRAPRGSRSAAPQPMVACAYCGVHLPRDEALVDGSSVFCGREHRIAFERDGRKA
ncbi:PP0621 family protein [Piscinibacter koreensis]|uniref:Preprotein translocase subunit YajC n=1 Tax=Piscinibacter koreensis TaxID=2742824 RepID=A0A7Y6NM65_9BURK|nr:PP0621 family protein [Schlegelella koreensis]NUZ05694.1 hypothetical protein [Schlegelella koreensis]